MSLLTLEPAGDGKAFFGGKTFSYKDTIRAVPGASWSRKEKRWEIPLDSVTDAMRILPTISLSSEVKDAYIALKKRHEEAIAIKDIDESLVSGKVDGLKGTLYPYQAVGKAFLETLEDKEGSVLAFDMGLGKSLTALAYFLELKNRGIVDHMLVVCPSALKYSTWAKEVKKWTDLEYIVIDGDKPEKVEWEDGTIEKLKGRALREVQYQQWEEGVDVLIMNYELFLHDAKVEKKVKGETTVFPDIIPNVNSRWLVVLDEAHRIKNPKASTTKNLIKKLDGAGRKVLGTGTPLENNVEELWSLTDFCRSGILGTYWKFLDRYIEKDFFGRPVAPKPQMMDELSRKIAPIMIRKTKAEALPDLPPLEIVTRTVDMTKAQRKLYDQVKAGIIEVIKTGEFTYVEALAQLTRLQQVCDSPALLRELLEDETIPADSGKLRELKLVIEELDWKRNKFILFSQSRGFIPPLT